MRLRSFTIVDELEDINWHWLRSEYIIAYNKVLIVQESLYLLIV